MTGKKSSNALIGSSLLFAVFLWGGNNSGTKFLVASWPPVWTGGSRFLCAGLLLLAILRWTSWLGTAHPLTRAIKRRLWWRGGLSLATYIVVFNSALRLTSASHVAVYLGASPIWALVLDDRPGRDWQTLRKYAAALLGLSGVIVLFWPALRRGHSTWPGEALGLLASVLWANFGRQCRVLGGELSGAESSAHTMWRAGLLLMPFAAVELWKNGLAWRADLVGVQSYCIIAGGVAAFAIWNHALSIWPTSQVFLFNNLIPLSTMTWAHLWLKESITPTFWAAMFLVMAGVALGQAKWLSPARAIPPE